MADVRLIDANSVCKKIAESIHDAEEWINEAKERQDFHGLRCASEAKTSLLAMLARIHDEPTIEAEPVKHGRWEHGECSVCGASPLDHVSGDMYVEVDYYPNYCPNCGSKNRMDGDSDAQDIIQSQSN